MDKIYKHNNITLIKGDCMEVMTGIRDKRYELAIVDPPYGIGASEGYARSLRNNPNITPKVWDCSGIPPMEYFDNLFKVSKEQIIWGGNYFPLPTTRCFLIWDKQNAGRDFADCEMAWTSFDAVARIFQYRVSKDYKQRIHPTQKPIALYKWLLKNYAKEGDKILDTHLGSGSSAIACYDMGFEFIGIELDEDYFKSAVKRFDNHIKQQVLFTPKEIYRQPECVKQKHGDQPLCLECHEIVEENAS